MSNSTNKVTFGWSRERHQRHDDCAKDPLDRRDGCGGCGWNIHCWLHHHLVVDCRYWMWNLQVVVVLVDGWSLLLFWLKQVDLRWCVKHKVNSFTSSSREAQVLVTLWWTDMWLFWTDSPDYIDAASRFSTHRESEVRADWLRGCYTNYYVHVASFMPHLNKNNSRKSDLPVRKYCYSSCLQWKKEVELQTWLSSSWLLLLHIACRNSDQKAK